MNDSSILKTSAAALAFFLGPLAWVETWHEYGTAVEPAAASGAVPENTRSSAALPS